MLEAHGACCVEDIIFKRPVIPKNHSVIYRNDLWLKVKPSNTRTIFSALAFFLPCLFCKFQMNNNNSFLWFYALS